MRCKHTYIFLLPSLLAGSFTQGFAQSVSDSLSQDHRVEDVVVTGTQTPRTLKKLPIITRIISRTELDRLAPRSAADALQMSLPGINVTALSIVSRSKASQAITSSSLSTASD
ncbi:hypothetical protein [Porphyromonas sp.]|uniref:hypothetical protein n=1 Tax=Porphyromonas sp. TaxID=1924944 RepID=UPI001CB2314F|nr:hypothetical protein [Porphyromonas sp.]MBF1395893.1 hypothetical protein [Porphyromonas sp.]